jgi:RNA polymerase sigma-70 factor (ECF subfamily)
VSVSERGGVGEPRGDEADAARVVAAFRAGLTGSAVVDPSAESALAEAVLALHARGGAGWPDFAIDVEAFATAVARRLGDAASASLVAALHHDVYVAIAATAGDEAAVVACDRIATREVDFAASRLRATAAQADEVRSDLRRLLFAHEDDRPAAISTFTGRGDLRGYARIIVARALARRIQRDRREVSLDDEMIDGMTPALDPEVAVLREQYRTDVDAAFRTALAALSDRARAVLRYHLLDGWSIDQIGERYGVHRSSAARWVNAAHAELGAGIRTALAARLSIPESQVDSIVALVTSRIDVSLERLLGGKTEP